ncbi:putative membrane protein [Propionispora sp. 2/2-37]|uniref:efflux RND transporter permease subunit n=1 Tax=Propionispora sp. 2/2-37 TaxID=1677858 RepID=UPI0006BB8EEF|nr:efflux RND transporter permease subunit [Propionispora sp. 2/2-37]CUH97031.1 putative membrane protein [Propionispora sp. 2/2-37]
MILTNISLKRPVFASVTILALVLLGLVSYTSLNLEEYPDVTFPVVTVTVEYPGANPEQVDSKIVQKIEDAVSSAQGVKHITSNAYEGMAYTIVEFTLETSPTVAAQDVRDKISKIRGDLPDDAEEPVISRYDPTQLPVITVALTGDLTIREMTTLVDDIIKKRFEAINGVGEVTVKGALTREIDINLDKDKVASYGLAVSDILASVQSENMEVPGGKLTKGNREVNMRTIGNITDVRDFLKIPLVKKDGVQLYLGNVADVKDGTEEMETVAKFNGKQAVMLELTKQSGANTVEVAKASQKVLEDLRKEIPPGTELTLVKDNSEKVLESVDDVLFNLVIGGLLAVIIVFMFLGNWRSTMISGITIPASIISTFFAMKIFDFTLNVMSLLALSLVVGILIDDAIVVIENIVRHMEMGKPRLRAAAEATEEIGLAVTATTLTLVAVFTPVGMMTGIVGRYFKQFGITVAFSVLVSLFIAFTLTPMLSAKYLDIAHGENKNWLGRMLHSWNAAFDRLTEKYGILLRRAMQHRLIILGIVLVLFVGSLGLASFLGSDFIAKSDQGEFTATIDLDAGTSVAGAAAIADKVTEYMKEIPEIVIVQSTASVDNVKIYVKLTPKQQRQRSITAIISELREKTSLMPGIKAAYLEASSGGEEYPVQIVIQGESVDKLGEIADQAKTIMEQTPGAVDVVSSYKPGKPDAQIVVKQEQAADLGVSTSSIASTLRTMFNGTTVGQYKDGDDSYDIVVKLKEENRTGIQDVSGIYLASLHTDSSNKVNLIPLSQVTNTVYSTSPSQIDRYDRHKQVKLTANLQGVSLGEFNTRIMNDLKQIEMPPGYQFVAIGEAERMGDTFSAMVVALVLAVSFIFFVLAAQFESYIDPFSIMLSLPLAIIGAILGLLVMHGTLSIMSMIGIIMLMGLVTKNAILLIDFAKQRMAEGIERNEALIEAAHIRMRPIMMTTAAMVFGMLPLAFGFGPGAEARAPMAHVIIGGLITSTILTLVVIPVIYTLLDDAKSLYVKRRESIS